jgi:hypothetical protein
VSNSNIWDNRKSWIGTTHKFSDSIHVGDAGEQIFLAYNPSYEKLGRTDNVDFRCRETGDTAELKTDNYDMSRTPNLFIERYSSDATMKPGGPYRNLDTTWWIYYYIRNDHAMWFRPRELIQRLEERGLADESQLIGIQNKGYTTWGWKIRRSDVLDIALCKPFRPEQK